MGAVPKGPSSGQAGGLDEGRVGGYSQRGWGILSSPLGSLGRDWKNRQRMGPAGVLTGQAGCCYLEQAGRGQEEDWGGCIAGVSLRGTWEGLISGGLPHRRDEAREGPGQTPPRPGTPATGSGSPGPEALGQRQKQKARSAPLQGRASHWPLLGWGWARRHTEQGRQADGQEARVLMSPVHLDRPRKEGSPSLPASGRPLKLPTSCGTGRQTSGPPSQLRPPQRPGWKHRAGPQRAPDSSPTGRPRRGPGTLSHPWQ